MECRYLKQLNRRRSGLCSAAVTSCVAALALVITSVVVDLALPSAWGQIPSPVSPGRSSAVRRSALSKEDVTKIDFTPDELFYLIPRIGIYHVDEDWRAQLTQLYRLFIAPGSDVLDLCSQHDSHLPPEVEYRSLMVHGMNYLELMANFRATSRFVQNFNRDQALGRLADESMDAVLMAVSIQYMQQPVALLKEIRRVLRPGGVVIVSFSDRMFFTKAIEAWREQRSMRGLAGLVQGYLVEAGLEGVRTANGVRIAQATEGWRSKNPFMAVVGFRDHLPGTATLDREEISWLAASGPGTIW